jgi:hypothetical protein
MEAAEDTTVQTKSAIAAFFDVRDEAEEAIDQLLGLGCSREEITLAEDHHETGAGPETPGEGGGLYGVLNDAIIRDGAEPAGDGGAARDGWVVTLEVDEQRYERAIRILGGNGSILRDERNDI